jgi:hypothetical protein
VVADVTEREHVSTVVLSTGKPLLFYHQVLKISHKEAVFLHFIAQCCINYEKKPEFRSFCNRSLTKMWPVKAGWDMTSGSTWSGFFLPCPPNSE